MNIIALGCFQGCELIALTSQERSISETFDDTSLRLKISQDLLLHPSGELDGIEVMVYQKKVLLIGTVSDAKFKVEADKIVKNIQDLKEIHQFWNYIQVGEESFGDYLSDTLTEKKLKVNLMGDGEVRIENYLIRVLKGVLYVIGSSASPQELKRVQYHVDQLSLRDAKYFVEPIPLKGKS
jgi:osmotically-inducible protein OsmY